MGELILKCFHIRSIDILVLTHTTLCRSFYKHPHFPRFSTRFSILLTESLRVSFYYKHSRLRDSSLQTLVSLTYFFFQLHSLKVLFLAQQQLGHSQDSGLK